MSSSEKYWEKREAESLKRYLTDEKEYSKRVKEIYTDMLDNVQAEIDSFYSRYASKEGITIAEAKKRVSKLDMDEYERKAKRYVKDREFSKVANEEMRIYNLTMKVNRLEMLKAKIGLALVSGHAELEEYMSEILQGRTEDELERQAGILGETVLSNDKKAEAIVNASFHNATFSDRIWMNQNLLKSELSKLLQSGLIQGKNPRALARDLRKRFSVSISNAERLMRTELARVQTEAQKQSFERNGFEQYTFLANVGCCPICQKLNGKHFKVIHMLPGKNAPPMHPYCRCSTSAYEDSEEYEAWLDYLDKGGTTEEWNKLKKKGKSIAKQVDSDIMVSSGAKEVADVHTVGKIDKKIYKCITEDIVTDEVIITDNQIQHIKDRHPNDYERFASYFDEIVKKPDYIIEANKPNTALILKEIRKENEVFKTVLRLATSNDNPQYKNSIITFMKIDEKEWNRLLRNKNVLYKRE